ncbi:HAMP domain-containing histidine kinase [Flavobacteriaceae bacterium TP-CH-4]|uniref:histidine kinase n=1 Tax=Pelagihabitans pacificus TaxID=2696054 RepID=A0A967ATY5_9FLAO|nr:HAMP domain-containing sensor histidine kinase [Pelagihabitans pacificus]NHF60336.1 HAMP domain-containing histidine kinase [Pelagihabitans pacificus]
MQKKINILIATAIATLLALIGIQAYLVYNTYELKKDAFLKETKKSIGRIDDESERVVTTNEIWAQEFMELLWQYRFENLSKERFVEGLTKNTDSLTGSYNRLYKEELKKTDLGYDIKFKKNIYSIIILDSVANDTMFPFGDRKRLFMLGEDFDEDQGYDVSQARWQTDYTKVVDGEEKTVEFRVVTRDRMNISDWKRIVLSRMAILLTGSVLLLLFVVGLFYYSIKNLIKQKKVADIKTDFINNITHELKTPLATLGIASKSLHKREIQESPEAFKNTLGILDRQNTRLQKLIDQVMTNSLGSEDLVLHKEQVIDDAYFNNLLDDFSLSVQSKNLTIDRHIESEEVVLRLDTFLFTTALFNILENAVKYGKESLVLTFTTRLRNNHYEIVIADNGIGINEKHLKYVFDKFFRVESGDVHNVKGLGLGLYYTKQVVDAHKGSIELESELGKGSKFSITIPVN